MNVRVNVTSGDPDWLRKLRFEPVVPVFHTTVGREVGLASDFEIVGEDVWAVLRLEPGTPKAARAAAVIIFGRVPRLVGVIFSDLPRPELVALVDTFERARTMN